VGGEGEAGLQRLRQGLFQPEGIAGRLKTPAMVSRALGNERVSAVCEAQGDGMRTGWKGKRGWGGGLLWAAGQGVPTDLPLTSRSFPGIDEATQATAIP
jgi:hypothetical protein